MFSGDIENLGVDVTTCKAQRTNTFYPWLHVDFE